MRFLAVLALFLPLSVGAQSLSGLGGVSPFTLSLSPQYPSPYSAATITPLSSTLELARATLTATVGGKEIYKGPVRPFSVPLGKAGSVVNVRAILAIDGAQHVQTISVVPQEVTLIPEPVASRPPLYPGKPSVPLGGSVRIVAVASLFDPAGKSPLASSYAYSWTVDGVRLANSSGVGKSAIIVDSPLQYRSREVSVAVMSAGGSLVGGASLALTAADPIVRLYANDPLLGIRFDHALSGRYLISGSEATLYAAPFSLPVMSSAPSVQWFLDSSPVQTGSSITLRPTGSGEGEAALSVTALAGPARAFTNLVLSFGSGSGSNFFGL